MACYNVGMATLSAPQPVTARRSRFKRAAPAPMRLTDDDLEIIRHIAKHRFLRSTHLALLMPHRSYKKMLERLGALYHNGFVDRPRAQLDYYATAGSAPIVYALGTRGALVLAERDGMDRAQVDWTWKNRSVGRLFHRSYALDCRCDGGCGTRHAFASRRQAHDCAAYSCGRSTGDAKVPPTRSS